MAGMLFVSYARQDETLVRPLVEGLRQLGYDVWLDERLVGGQAWWDTILEKIRACDGLVVVVSPSALESVAVTREYEYAHSLDRPLLPVLVAAVRAETLPPLLAKLQLVDFTAGQAGAFQLAAALSVLPQARPLPDPLPEPPKIPMSYLSELTQLAQASHLTLDEQLALVVRLGGLMHTPTERNHAIDLLRALQRRPDLYHATAQEIQRLIPADQSADQPADQSADRPGDTPPAENRVPVDDSVPQPGSADEWKVRQLVANPKLIRVVVTRKEPHEIEYKYGTFRDTLTVDGRKIDEWVASRTVQFTINDGADVVPAAVTHSMTAWGGMIKKLQIRIAGLTVYEYSR